MIQRPKNITDTQWEQAIALYNTAKSKGDRYPELTVAQAALETGWFKSPSGKYNYFGQKASKNQQGTTLSTKEMSGNKTYSIEDKFRDYNSIEEAVDDRIKKWGSKYKNAETVDDAINIIWQYDPKTGQGKGYATDVNYGSKLKSILGSLGVSSGASNPNPTESQLPEYVNFADVGELPSSQGIVFGEQEITETEEKKPEGVKAADKLNELSFVEELKNLYESEPIQEQQQQVYAEALPTVQVTPLEYSPIEMPNFQKGGTWQAQQAKMKAEKDAKLKALLAQEKPVYKKKTIDEKIAEKIVQENTKTIQKDNTVVRGYNNAEKFSKEARNKTDKEIAEERQARIDAQVKANEQPFDWSNFRQSLADRSQATGDALRVSNEPNFFDDYLNPASMIGSMADNLGQAPLQAQQTDSILPYFTSVGTPLAVGAMAGYGTQNTGQFVNNLANPLAGTGDLINNFGNKHLPNAYKLNPNAFKPNPEAYYRMIGDEGLTDLQNVGYVRSNPNTFYADKNPFFSKGYPIDGRIGKSVIKDSKYLGNNMIEVGGNNEIGNRFVKNRWADAAPDSNIFVARDKIGINNPNLKVYEKDWLKGYKQVEVPNTNTKAFKPIEIPKTTQNQLPEPEPFLYLDVNTPQSINLNRTEKAGKNVYKETLEEGNLIINKRGGTPENPKTITIKTKTGAIQATQNPDGSYMFHNAVDSKIDAGKAMLELNKHLPKKPTIFETSSMSTDSYTNLLKIGKNKDWKSSFEGFSALNDSNKNVNFLDDLLKWKNRGANAAFVSEKTAIEAQRRMNSYLNKLGYDESTNVLQRNGEWQMEIPNYRVQRNYQQGGIIKDNRGQWEHPGEITQISSPNITMKNVPYPVFAIADTGERKLMQPEQDYYFKGAKTVTEYPILQVGGQIVQVDRGDGKIEDINTNSEEYRKLYEEGRVLGREGDTLLAPQELNDVTITAFRKTKQEEPQFKVDEQELQQRLDNPYNFEAKKDATSVTKEEILPEVKKGQNLPNIKEVKELASTYKTETEKLLKRRQELFDNRYNDLNPEEELDETLDINKLKTKDDVLKVQKRLYELGYNLNPKGSFENDGVDGKLGNVTKKAIDTYNQTKAKNIYSSYKEGEGLLGKCTEKQCSEYAQNEIFRNFKPSVKREIWNEKTGLYGDAWTIGKNIEQAGGKKVEKVQPGDAVTMYTGGASSYLGEAKKHGTDATHIGIVDKVNPDGSYYILHNVHEGSRGSYEGREYRDLIKDGKIISGGLGRSFEIRGSYRPNYDAVKDYEKKSKVREDVALTIHPKKLEELQSLNKSYTGANIQKNVNEFMQPLNNINNKKVMTQKHGLTEEEYQSIAKLSLGILAQESGFGTSDKLLPKEIAAKTLETVGLMGEASEGAGQIKYKTNYGDSDLTEFGINESNFDESSKTPLVVADRIATYYRQLIKKGETKENALYKAVEKYNRGSNTKYADSKDSDYVNKVVNFSELFLVQDKKGKAYNTTTDKLLLEKQVAKKKVAK